MIRSFPVVSVLGKEKEKEKKKLVNYFNENRDSQKRKRRVHRYIHMPILITNLHT